jgi:septal ring factor EnvC (AmiA/AmiB activator)
MFLLRLKFVSIAFMLLPLLAWGQSVKDTQAVLTAAEQAAADHRAVAAEARHQARLDAEQAALLAEEQVEAAANLRRLEAETGGDAARLATLQAQSNAAQQALAKSEAALANLLPIMQRLSAEPAATIFATPESPEDSVRGILVLQEIAGEIERQAVSVRTQADAAAVLLQKMTAEQNMLANAVLIQQNAETALNAQIAAAQAAEAADADVAAREAADAIKGDHDRAAAGGGGGAGGTPGKFRDQSGGRLRGAEFWRPDSGRAGDGADLPSRTRGTGGRPLRRAGAVCGQVPVLRAAGDHRLQCRL